MSNAQLACTYAALILSESGKLDAASIAAVTKAGGVTVSPGLAAAFADALKTVDVKTALGNLTFAAGPAGGAAAAPAGGAAAAPAAAAKKQESESDEDDGIGFGLFD